jgi:hypothetical protein
MQRSACLEISCLHGKVWLPAACPPTPDTSGFWWCESSYWQRPLPPWHLQMPWLSSGVLSPWQPIDSNLLPSRVKLLPVAHMLLLKWSLYVNVNTFAHLNAGNSQVETWTGSRTRSEEMRLLCSKNPSDSSCLPVLKAEWRGLSCLVPGGWTCFGWLSCACLTVYW